MLVGLRRRLLNFSSARTSRATARWSRSSASASEPDRARYAGARVPAHHREGEGIHTGRHARADDRARLLSLRLQPGLHRPAQRLQRGFWRSSRPQGARLFGVSCDASWSQAAFRKQLGVDISQLSDFEPKGATCRAFGVYHDAGFAQRAMVINDPDGVVQVEPSDRSRRHAGGEPDLRRSRRRPPARLTPMTDPRQRAAAGACRRRSRARPGRRAARDRVRRLRVPLLRGRARAPGARYPVRRVFRHFPVRSKHPRAWALACAAEAAARQGRFWEMHYARSTPTRAASKTPTCGSARGNSASTSTASRPTAAPTEIAARVRRDFEAGIRAGVVTTPTLFIDNEAHGGIPDQALLAQLATSD